MKKIDNKIRFIILTIVLLIISAIVILINGNTYTIKVDTIGVEDANTLDIIIKEDIVKLVDKKIVDGDLLFKIESVKPGKTYIDVKDDQAYYYLTSVYVHQFGTITIENMLGDCNGDRIIPISITILMIYALIILIQKYKNQLNKCMYQYKNIECLGLIIFLSFAVINQMFTIANYNGLISTIKDIIGLCSIFSFIALPVAFITSVLVTISNIVLIIKEGFSFRNIIGIVLGLFFCIASITPGFLNDILQNAVWIDVHNEQGIAVYIQSFIEFTIYVVVVYLECILIGTVILGIKSARHIPKLNKDYIIILGCQIKKDGTLTNLLKARVDRAIEFKNIQKEKTGKDIVFVPSGGQGEDEIMAEGQAMKNYLINNGINEDEILVEDKSKNTYENIKFSTDLIKNKQENANIAISTTNYHVYRAGVIANNQGIQAEGIGAKTKTYFWLNAFIREFIATMYSERKKHIAIVLEIILTSTCMIFLTGISNIV